MLSRIKLRFRALLFRSRVEDELQAELRFHIERETEENLARGVSPEEARRAALRSFGGVERVKEESRDVRGLRFLEDAWRDLRYGARTLRKEPGFAWAVVLTLALGIGANVAVFSVINGVLLRPLPYRDPERLYMVFVTRPQIPELPVMGGEFVDLRGQNEVFEQVAAFQPQPLTLTGEGEPEPLNGVNASASLFGLLGVSLRYGRGFLTEEERPGGHRVVILSHRLWERRYGSDPKVIGRAISLNGEPYMVVGVAPAGFQFPRKGDWQGGVWFSPNVDFYTPLALTPEQAQSRRGTSLAVIGRLKPQLTPEQAQIRMAELAKSFQRRYPESSRDKGLRIVSLYQQVVGRARLALVALAGAVGFVLLISCANVANLLLARASTRRKELAVRAALGAGRGRMIRQLLAESALLAGLGGSLALLLAFWWVKLLGGVIPDDLPRADQIGVDARVLGFTLAASLLSALLFGLAPALLASRIDLNETLKDGGRASAGGGSPRFRNLLVVCEMALAVALLVGAGLMTRSFVRLMGVDPGLDPRNVLTMEIKLPRGRYASPRQQAAFYRGLLERARALPGVQAASAVYPLPLSGMEDNIGFRVEGLPLPDGEWPAAGPRCVGTDYFKALGIRLLKGRDFNEADGADAPPVVIVNESLARQYWPNQDPVGGRLAFNLHNDGQTVWREVVGVARDVRQRGLDVESRPEIYFPFVQFPISSMALVMRANGDPLNYAAAARAQAQAVDGDQAVSKIHTMEELLETSVSQRRFNLTMLAVFAGLALALAGVRIYGVMAYLVNERAHEIGVRMALGARPAAVLGLVLRRGMSLALTGVALGLLTAFWLTRLIKNLLFGVSASDPLTFTGIALLLLVVAFLACWLPARRAMKVNPIFALRCNG